MVKLKRCEMHKLENVPDHIVQQLVDLADKMLVALEKIAAEEPSSLILGAMNFVHAATVIHLVNEDAAHDASKGAAISLIKNVEMLLRQKGVSFVPLGQD